MDKIFNIGIIGCGRAAQQLHLPVLGKLSSVNLLMASDMDNRNLETIQRLAPKVVTSIDFNEVINNPAIDIVAVLTPGFLHKEIAITALNAGKHVFIEKPLALTSPDCQELVDIETKAKGRATVGFNLRFHPLIKRAQSMVRNGAIGRVESVRSVWTGSMRQKISMPAWRGKRELGGSALFEVGVHHFDLWKLFVGEEIVEISARGKIVDGIERSVVINAMSNSGIPISAFFSDWTADSNDLEIFGDQGLITVSLYRIDGLRHHTLSDFAGGMSTRIKDARQQLSSLSGSSMRIPMGGDYKSSFYFEWENFLADIRNSEYSSPRLVDGKYATRVALAASQSVLSKGSVAL